METRISRRLRILNLALSRALRFSVKNPKKVVGGAFAAFIALSTQVPNLKKIISTDDLLEAKFPSTRAYEDLKRDFHLGNSALLVISRRDPKSRFTERELCAVRKWFSEERAWNPAVRVSFSPFDLREARKTENRLVYPEIMNLDCTSARDEPSFALDPIHATPWSGVMVSRTRHDLVFELTLKEGAKSVYGTFTPQVIEGIRARFAETIPPKFPALVYYWAGTSDFQFHQLEGMEKSTLLNFAILFFLVFAMRVFFGSFSAGFAFALVLILGGGILFGLMAIFGAPMDVLSSGLFLMVVVASLEDFVFLCYRRLKFSEPWRRSFREMILASFLTSVTTIIGFAALCISDLSIIRRFGFWSGMGAVIEWILVFLVLPAILVLWRRGRPLVNPEKAHFVRFFERCARLRMPRKFAIYSLLIFAFMPWAIRHVNVTDTPIELFPASHPLRAGIDYLRNTRGWEVTLNVVFRDFADRAKNETVIREVAQLKGVVEMENPYVLQDFMTRGQPALTEDLIKMEITYSQLYKRLVSEDKKARVVLYVTDTSLETIRFLRKEIERICQPIGCEPTGGMIAYADFADEIPKTLLESLVVSLLLVSATVVVLAFAVRLRPLADLGWLLISAVWGPMLILLLVAITQLRVNFMSCVFASVLVGLTGDNAIQFLCASRKKGLLEGMDQQRAATFQCSTLMASGALFFLGSYFLPARTFGILLCLGLLIATAGDVWILGSFLHRSPKQKKTTSA